MTANVDLLKLVALLDTTIDACFTAELSLAGTPLAEQLMRCRLVLTRASGYIGNAAEVTS